MTTGRVCTGFSKPYVAWLQDSNDGFGIYSISGGRKLARGVSVSVDIDSSNDNNFFANNGGSESSQTLFFGGTLTLVVDGLFEMPERLIMGNPQKESGWICYDDRQKTYYIVVAFIVRYQSNNEEIYVPIIFPKCLFNPISATAETHESQIGFQTQELTAKIYRLNDAKHTWKWVGRDYATEEAAENAIKAKLHIV